MKAVLIVLTNPGSPDADAAYNDWYTKVHVPYVLEVPGYVSAIRYKAFPAWLPIPQQYLTIYDLNVTDAAHVQRISDEHMRRIGAGEMRRSPDGAMDRDTMRAMYYLERSPRQTSKLQQADVPNGVFLAYAAPAAAERAAELDHWYDTQHLPDVLDLPGFTAAQRYTASTPPECRDYLSLLMTACGMVNGSQQAAVLLWHRDKETKLLQCASRSPHRKTP